MNVAPSTAPFQSASLYVGDLHPDITEGFLFELFNRVGPVASIRVCRDAVTRRSLGYAYVNFHNVQDAERALDTMNFNDIKGRACRIMWSQRDPSLRKSGVGNIFVKNLPPSVDNKGLFDTFSVYGNILSCKVATDESGNYKGYGYVHYETAEAAQDAIQKFNGNTIDDLEVFVGPFVRRQDRGQSNWTNLYVKQFPTYWDEDKLRGVFEAYGPLASLAIARDAEGKSKRFGFVNYNEHESASNALKELANKAYGEESGETEPFELYVNRAQKRLERTRDIKTRLDALREERVSKYQGMNLYVKNLDDSISDEMFKETFGKYGTITSARIMRNPGDNVSKGFGFICYSSAEEATRAVTEQNGKILAGKPIVVTLHQRKDVRRAHLAATYAPRMRYPQGSAGMPMPYMPMYVPQGGAGGQPGFPPQQRGFFPPNQGQQGYPPNRGGNSPRGMPFPGRGQGGPMPPNYFPMGGPPQQYVGGPQMQGPGQGPFPGNRGVPPQAGRMGMPPNQMQVVGPQGQQGARRPGPGGPAGGRAGPGRGPYMGAPMQQMQPGGPQQQMNRGGPQGGLRFNSNVRNQMGNPGMMGQQMAPMPMAAPSMGDPLDDQALAQADPQMQKNMIGEKLYPLIYETQPQLAGKITGMLLEMDNAELLNLIESPDALSHKVEEALVVLRNHHRLGADE